MRKPIVFPSGRTISQLAEELGVSRCYIWKLVQGGYDEQGIIDWFNRIVPYRKAQERGLRPSLVYQRKAIVKHCADADGELYDAIQKKMTINFNRSWKKQANGSYHH